MSTSKRGHKSGRTRRNPNFLSPSIRQEIDGNLRSLFNRETEAETYRGREILSLFWSKYSSPGLSTITGKKDSTPRERKERAIAKWLRANDRCRKTNLRLNDGVEISFRSKRSRKGFITSSEILTWASKFICDTIGAEPPLDMGISAFSGGASTRVKRGPGTIASKFEGKAHVSASALPWFVPLMERYGLWRDDSLRYEAFEIIEHSVMFTVPKNSEIDRVACKEPEINMYLQKSVGDFFRHRLKRSGIDLNDQTRNQRLARLGSYRNGQSASRRLSTLDLSSASDTVSTELVKQLLPSGWFDLLNALRVKWTVLPSGETVPLEMFSSMGNGFTFELESLIFWALTRSVAFLSRSKGTISVYGDDIIAPRDVALHLQRVLPYFGFILNKDKSYVRGFYRESCGKAWLFGSDVTPVYHREYITEMTQVIRLYNQLLRVCVDLGDFADEFLLRAVQMLLGYIPQALYGGHDFDSITAAVTWHAPRKLLKESVRKVSTSEVGAYVQWHHEAERLGPSREPLMTSCASVTTGVWVLRPNRESRYDREQASAVRHTLLTVLPSVTDGKLSLGSP
ncbi:RNA-directed RNA polymerase [ssRNA phage SRR6255746_4]|uniref:RNA-directed RNA polymerase n=1 Tax=ssRNA phage SRR6255746_4 TaxID=2786506 RepID=A0A8S5L0W2_9VIRU|nr:RNA-directed RNA polymerase [ssRNA phage SRR6255746_4]DAD50965.1 TPA_asm: RNA-directed RNA polymerase [ssRNA phage SRR6255746_4]